MPPKTGGIFVYIRIYNIGAVAFAKAGEVLRGIIRIFISVPDKLKFILSVY